MVNLGHISMDTTAQQNAQLSPEEIVRKATAELAATPREKRNRIRRSFAQSPVVVEAVAQVVTARAESLAEVLKLGDEVVYRGVLSSWRLTTVEQRNRIIGELHQSTSEQYRRLALAVAIGLVSNYFNDA